MEYPKLNKTYISEKGILRVPRKAYEAMNLSDESDKVFLTEKNNCIILSREYKTLPISEVYLYGRNVVMDVAYCNARELFVSENECLREKTEYIQNKNGRREKCTILESEYSVKYFMKDSAMIIPLSKEQMNHEYYFCTFIENGIINLPSFIVSVIRIGYDKLLKAEVRDGIIHVRRCPRTTKVIYDQIVTASSKLEFTEQLLRPLHNQIELESFMLKAACIKPNDTVRLKLVTNKDFVIEPLYKL